MDIYEAIENRHSVRSYLGQRIEEEVKEKLNAEIDACNAESGLNIQLVTDEPDAFGGYLAHYGSFRGVRNYIALVGKKSPDLNEELGWYGERLTLLATMLGLDSCWVAVTYSKGEAKCEIKPGEALCCVIAIGNGKNHGVPHKSRPMSSLCSVSGEMPDWFRRGMNAVMLAPTAKNQQRFMFTLSGNTVTAEAKTGIFSKMDLGIVKYHFEIGAGKENFVWG